MKTRYVIFALIGITILVVFVTTYGIFTVNSEPRSNSLLCGGDFIQQGNGCVLDTQFIEPNIIIIYDAIDNGGTRLSIAPHDIMMDLEEDNTITFVNEGMNTVNIFDNSKGLWRFENVEPSSQRELIINDTGFYKVLVQSSREGESCRIVALSDDTNSLPVEIRAKMAQTIVGSDFRKDVGLISVGSGGAEPGITIGIHEKFQDKPDAEQFYYEKYKSMIPFDVPIWIKFTSPIITQTG